MHTALKCFVHIFITLFYHVLVVMDAQLPTAQTVETITFPENSRMFSNTNATVLQIVIPAEAIQHRFTVEG